jgi:hypothetical protein
MTGGILLYSDLEMISGAVKSETQKIYRLRWPVNIPPNSSTEVKLSVDGIQIFIAGSNNSAIFAKARIEIEQEIGHLVKHAITNGEPVELEHGYVPIIESCLQRTAQTYIKTPSDEIGCILVVQFPLVTHAPILYYANCAVGGSPLLQPIEFYVNDGIGYMLGNYLSRRLYNQNMSGEQLIKVAAFILREASECVANVGAAAEMYLINEGWTNSTRILGPDAVKTYQQKLPSLTNVLLPELLATDFAP